MRTTRLAAAAMLAAFSCAATGARAQNQPATPAGSPPASTTPASTTPATAAPATAAPANAAPAPAPVAPASGSAAPAAQAAPPAVAPPNPVVAKVGDTEIHMSDVQAAAGSVPAEYRQLPPQMLFPLIIDQLIDRDALTDMARKQNLEKDPRVAEAMHRASEAALQNALVARVVGPQVGEAAVKARYDADLAKKPGEEEVHARHILVASEDEAKKIIADLNAGGDFATLAKAHSTDPGAAQGGDLGWFKKGDMLPEFSAVAFALQPGQISQTPVHTRYGWHVIKVEGRRTAPAPSFEQARDQLRQQMIQNAVQKLIKEARAGVTVVKFNPDGSVPKPTDSAMPPSPAASAPAPGSPSPGASAPTK